MKIRPNVKYLVNKYHDKISAWRADGPLVASWEQISRELCSRENLTGTDQPTGDGLRKAWAKQSAIAQTSQNSETSQKMQTIQTNRVETPVVEPSATKTEAAKLPDKSQTSQNSETTQKMQTLQTYKPANPVITGFPPVPSDKEYELLPISDKVKWGKPATTPDGRRIWTPLSEHEIKMLEVWSRHDRCDAGEL